MRFNFYLDDNYGLDGEARAHPRDSHVILPLPISTRVRPKRSSAIFLAVPHISLYRVLPLLSKGSQVVKFEFKSYAKFSELPIPNRCPTCDQVEGGVLNPEHPTNANFSRSSRFISSLVYIHFTLFYIHQCLGPR